MLPVGNGKEIYGQMLTSYKYKNEEEKQKIKDRYETLLSLKPKAFRKCKGKRCRNVSLFLYLKYSFC